ncbi:hypothetical protein ABT282_31060 [Streptomyces sp. NPDC000927]|uniref:hypothetical protein n=1 Tax=Streptomyces sp. NPDC000927 TaxID=3154371 RepID=UPI0033264CBA
MDKIVDLSHMLSQAQQAVNDVADERAIAIAEEAERLGRGGQAAIAKKLNIKEPQVARLVARGRCLIAKRRA